MSKIVSNIPTIWENEVFTVLSLLKNVIDDINDNLIPQVNENSADIETLQSSISSLPSDIENLKQIVAEMQAQINSADNTIEQHTSSLNSLNSSVAEMQNQINAADNTIEQHTSSLNSLNQSVEAINEDLQIKGGEITSLENEVDRNSDKISDLEYLTEVVLDTTSVFTIPDSRKNYLVDWGVFPPGDCIIKLPLVGPGRGSYKVQHIYFKWPAGSENTFNLSVQDSSGALKPFTVGYNSYTGTGTRPITLPTGITNFVDIYLGHLEIVYLGTASTSNALVRLV